jgi:hypothetical protein
MSPKSHFFHFVGEKNGSTSCEHFDCRSATDSQLDAWRAPFVKTPNVRANPISAALRFGASFAFDPLGRSADEKTFLFLVNVPRKTTLVLNGFTR